MTSGSRSMSDSLDRFVAAQQDVYGGVIEELRRGQKTGHWIWFIFPQIAGLGRSPVSQHYAIDSMAEARRYLAHPVLGPRLHECAAIVLAIKGRTADEIFGTLDAMKLRSSMTLFHRCGSDGTVFAEVLDRYYGGVADEATDERLRALLPEDR